MDVLVLIGDVSIAFAIFSNAFARTLTSSWFLLPTRSGLLTNFLSFSPFSYKLGLTRTLVDRTFKIKSTWTGFHNNIKELINILEKSQFPSCLVNSIVQQHLSIKFFDSTSRVSTEISPNETSTHYYKLPLVGPFLSIDQHRIRRLTQCFCKDLDIKLVFAPYKIKNSFVVKDAIPKSSRPRIVYKFSCAGVQRLLCR